MIRRAHKILFAVLALTFCAVFVLKAQDGKKAGAGIIKVVFDYTTDQGAKKCGNAGAYSVFIRTGEKEDEGVRVDASRDTRLTKVIPEGAGVTASAEKGEQDRLILTIESAVTGKRDITVRQYLPVTIEGVLPDYEQTVNVDIIAGKEVQLIVPVFKEQKPEVICPVDEKGATGTATGTATGVEPVAEVPKEKNVEKALVTGKGRLAAVAKYYKKTAQVGGGAVVSEEFAESIATGIEIILDGTGSGLGGNLTYEWTQLSGPPVKISDSGKQKASFTPQKSGLYRVRLRVSDGKLSQYDGLEINVVGAMAMRQEPRLMSMTELDMPGDFVYLLQGKAVVVNRGRTAFQVLDVSDPLNVKKSPVVAFKAEGFGGFGKMYMSGSYLYAAIFKGEDKNALAVFDFTEPSAPKLIGFADMPFVLPIIVARGGGLYTENTDGKNVKVYDVSAVNEIKEARNFALSLQPKVMPGGTLQVYSDGLIGSRDKEIFTIDLNDGKLKTIGAIAEDIEGFSMLATDGMIYVFTHVKDSGGDESVIWTYKFSGEELKRVGEMKHEKGMLFKSLKSGDYLYLARQLKEGTEVEFVDVGQPVKPVVVGRYFDKKTVIYDFDVDGDILVIIGNVDGKDALLVMRESS